MSFADLPNEVLEQIIPYTLPEGFEGFALSCKLLYALCTPYLARYNELRFFFHDFEYYKAHVKGKSPLKTLAEFPYSMGSAYNLLEQITVEPIVARYVQNANFDFDSGSTRKKSRNLVTDENRVEGIAELLASSPYLKEAGLDWRSYHYEIQNDLDNAKYSQHAAEFVLTLLPNLKTFRLPKYWRPLHATDRLIGAVTKRAKQTPLSLEDPPSMAQVTNFKSSSFRRIQRKPALDRGFSQFHLHWAIPFLSLPRVQYFCGPIDIEGHGNSLTTYPHGGSGMALEEIDLQYACVDWISIANFLKHTPNLKTLRYAHWNRRMIGIEDWDLCRFIAAIAEGVGSHLTELSISINKSFGDFLPGNPSVQGFQQLQKLKLPLEIATFALNSGLRSPASLLGSLVPASVSHLSLTSHETRGHGLGLDIMFYEFGKNKAFGAPNLKELYLPYPSEQGGIGFGCFAALVAEAEKVGVAVHTVP